MSWNNLLREYPLNVVVGIPEVFLFVPTGCWVVGGLVQAVKAWVDILGANIEVFGDKLNQNIF